MNELFKSPRPIKFRSWCLSDNLAYMRYSDKENDGSLHYFFGNCDVDDTVMQYTGIEDKNGVPVYEGDIVVEKRGPAGYWCDILKVEYGGHYNICGFGLTRPRRKNDNQDVGSNPTWDTLNTEYSRTFEVIGNIYENPELLTNPQKGVTHE